MTSRATRKYAAEMTSSETTSDVRDARRAFNQSRRVSRSPVSYHDNQLGFDFDIPNVRQNTHTHREREREREREKDRVGACMCVLGQ